MRSLRCAARNDDNLFMLGFQQAAGLHACTAKRAEEETATTRAPGAIVRNSAVFRDRSASGAAVARGFSPCLSFWYFWVKPKVQKEADRLRPITLEASRINVLNLLQGNLLPPFVTKRWSQKCPQPTPAARAETACGLCRARRRKPSAAKVWHLRRERTTILTERAQKTALFCTPAPGVRTDVRSFSVSGAMRSLRCAARNDMCGIVSLLPEEFD